MSSLRVRAGLTVLLVGLGGTAMADEPVSGGSVPSASMTVHTAATQPAAVAQNGLGVGPLQGPLGAPGAGACCPCRTVRHAVHRTRRVVRRAPVTVARAYVPLVPLVPYRPVYVWRPVVPVYAYRPYFYRSFVYRPFYGRYY